MLDITIGALDVIFGAGVVGSLQSWMTELWNAILAILAPNSNNIYSMALDIFSGVAASLLILYFFMDMLDHASRDMFTFEKFVTGIIKLFIGVAILICLKDIVYNIAQIGKYSYLSLKDLGTENAGIFPDGFYNSSEMETALEKWGYKGIKAIFTHFRKFVIFGVIQVIGLITTGMGYLVCTSNAAMIIIYAIFSPIAVANCFKGTESSGIRYLKKFTAHCITMAAIVISLHVTSALNTSMAKQYAKGIDSNKKLHEDKETFNKMFIFSTVPRYLVPQLVTVGAMSACAKVTTDIFGA